MLQSLPHTLPWLDLLLKATAVLAAAALAAHLLRRASAATRHALWSTAILIILALPAMLLLIPAHRALHILPTWTAPAAPLNSTPQLSQPAPSHTFHVAPAPSQEHILNLNPTPIQSSSPTPTASPSQLPDLPTLLIALWLAGTTAALLPLLISPLLLRHIRRQARTLADPSWIPLLTSLRSRLAIRPNVLLLSSNRHSIPMTFGILCPVIILPVTAETWPADRRRMVLLHELAHIRRLDSLMLLISRLACALYWFHPLAWFAVRRLRIESERACDNLVLNHGTKSADYAATLVDIAFQFGPAAQTPKGALSMARLSHLEDRVRSVLSRKQNRRPLPRSIAIPLLLLLTSTAVPLAMLRAQITQSATTPEPGYTFSGIVVDEKGAPVPNVRVDHSYSRERYTAQTGSDGRFTMHLKAGISRYHSYIATTADGTRMGFLSNSGTQTTTTPNASIVLHAARNLAVSVLDENAAPVAGALVVASSSYTQVGQATTDARGDAHVRVPSDAPLSAVTATKPGVGTDYFVFWWQDAVRNDPYRLDPAFAGPFKFVLNGAKNAIIRAVDEENRPIAGADVYPCYFEKPSKGGELNMVLDAFHCVTNAQGLARCQIIPADDTRSFEFAVEKDGYTSAGELIFDPTQTQPGELKAVLLKKVPLTGRVLDERGQPAAGATVMVCGCGYEFPWFADDFKTRADGTFSHEVAADMCYIIAAKTDHGMSRVAQMPVLRKSPAPLELRLEAAGPKDLPVLTGSITGILRTEIDDKSYRQLPNPRGRRDIESPSLMFNPYVSPKDGAFELYVTPGEYSFSCDTANGSIIESVRETVEITSEKEKEIRLHFKASPDAPREMHGRVLLADNPLIGAAEAELQSEYAGGAPRLDIRAPTGTADKLGNFTLRRTVSDFYLIAISKDRKFGAMQLVKADAEGIALALRPTALARGKLADAQGKPAAAYVVSWNIEFVVTLPREKGRTPESDPPQSYSYLRQGSTKTAADGTFIIDGLLVGSKYSVETFNPDPRQDEHNIQRLLQVSPTRVEELDLGMLTLRKPTILPAPAQP